MGRFYGIFNVAVKRGRFDRNPVAAVRQRPEPPGRDRIVSPAEFRTLWGKKLAHLPAQCAVGVRQEIFGSANMLEPGEMLAGSTGLEPAASGVTGRRSNQLNYDPECIDD